jgi:uncharacterized protein YggE
MTTQEPFALTVSGSAVIPLLAERAKIHVTVSNEGLEKAAVSHEVISTAKQIETMLRQLAPQDDSLEAKAAASLAHWSKTSLSATSYLPYANNANEEESERRYKSDIRFDIRFQNFKALGSFATALSSISNVEVGQIEWLLTEETKTSYHSQLRKDAAKDAMSKARDYCDVFGCENLRPVELDDTEGMYSHKPMKYHRSMQTARRAPQYPGTTGEGMAGRTLFRTPGQQGVGEESESPDLEFDPQSVQMSMEVTVKFHAE